CDCPRLSPAASRTPIRFPSKANATRQTPPPAPNRSSLRLAIVLPFRVSTVGRPSVGPNCANRPAWASILSERQPAGHSVRQQAQSETARPRAPYEHAPRSICGQEHIGETCKADHRSARKRLRVRRSVSCPHTPVSPLALVVAAARQREGVPVPSPPTARTPGLPR